MFMGSVSLLHNVVEYTIQNCHKISTQFLSRPLSELLIFIEIIASNTTTDRNLSSIAFAQNIYNMYV